jgi:hypothetical protein
MVVKGRGAYPAVPAPLGYRECAPMVGPSVMIQGHDRIAV